MFKLPTPKIAGASASLNAASAEDGTAEGQAAEPAALPTTLGMAVCDASGRLTFLSPAIQELIGSSFEADAASQHLYRSDGLTRLRPGHLPLARASRGEIVTDAVICHRSEDEVPTYLRCNAAPVEAADGSANGAVVFVQDVTAGHVGQQNRQRTQEHLISALNHEFRTPLTKLVGHAERLHDMRGQLPLPALHSLEKMRKAADELRELADLVSSMADVESPGGATEGDPAESFDQLARRLSTVPKIPLQLVASLDPDRPSAAIAVLAREPASPRFEA